MDLAYVDNEDKEIFDDRECQKVPAFRVRRSNTNSRLDRISRMLGDAVLERCRYCIISCDLWCPKGWHDDGNERVSQFFASLQAQLDSDGERKCIQGKSVGKRKIRYIWVRQSPLPGSIRYRIAFLVNEDVYRNLGGSGIMEPKLQGVSATTVTPEVDKSIRRAWATSLQLSPGEVGALIEFTGGATYTLSTDSGNFAEQCRAVFLRISHVIEAAIRGAEEDPNGFGCSLPRVRTRRHSAG